jgi:hypothetical protein
MHDSPPPTLRFASTTPKNPLSLRSIDDSSTEGNNADDEEILQKSIEQCESQQANCWHRSMADAIPAKRRRLNENDSSIAPTGVDDHSKHTTTSSSVTNGENSSSAASRRGISSSSNTHTTNNHNGLPRSESSERLLHNWDGLASRFVTNLDACFACETDERVFVCNSENIQWPQWVMRQVQDDNRLSGLTHAAVEAATDRRAFVSEAIEKEMQRRSVHLDENEVVNTTSMSTGRALILG